MDEGKQKWTSFFQNCYPERQNKQPVKDQHKGATSVEIHTQDELIRCNDIRLYKAALKGDWKEAKAIIKIHGAGIMTNPITNIGDNALHIAVAAKHKGFVKNLIEEMSKENLAKKNKHNNTSLHYAAATGVVEIADMLIKKNDKLPNITGAEEIVPIHIAALFSYEKMVSFLYKKTNFSMISDEKLMNLFLAIISADIYDVALAMLDEMPYRRLAIKRNSDKETALHLMARKPSSISDKDQLNFFQKLANSIYMRFSREEKKRTSAYQLVEKLWKLVLELPKETMMDLIRTPSRLLFDAAKTGNIEFLVILIRSYPDLIWKVDENRLSLYHVAALNRHENIFNIIYELGGIKDLIASYVEKNSDGTKPNNLLHLVARLPPPNRLQVVSGAALQMQRELLWFKAVKEMVPRTYIKAKNNDGKMAHEIFMKEHEDLQKEGEKWMKETATACMLVATLIATVVFTAALTVPGGNDDKSGFPRFRTDLWFDVFIISDSVSLFSSVIAIVMFLSILTSRYAEDDFRKALPTKLMLGILALFVSIISMVLAFTLSLILIRNQKPIWSLVLIICLASLTALSFIFLHFKLWFDTLISAYWSRFLFRRHRSGIFL